MANRRPDMQGQHQHVQGIMDMARRPARLGRFGPGKQPSRDARQRQDRNQGSHRGKDAQERCLGNRAGDAASLKACTPQARHKQGADPVEDDCDAAVAVR